MMEDGKWKMEDVEEVYDHYTYEVQNAPRRCR